MSETKELENSFSKKSKKHKNKHKHKKDSSPEKIFEKHKKHKHKKKHRDRVSSEECPREIQSASGLESQNSTDLISDSDTRKCKDIHEKDTSSKKMLEKHRIKSKKKRKSGARESPDSEGNPSDSGHAKHPKSLDITETVLHEHKHKRKKDKSRKKKHGKKDKNDRRSLIERPDSEGNWSASGLESPANSVDLLSMSGPLGCYRGSKKEKRKWRESVEDLVFSDEQLGGLQHTTSSERNSELHSERASSGTSKGCSSGSKKEKRKGRESVEEMDFSDEQLAGLQHMTSSERNSELHSERASSGTSKGCSSGSKKEKRKGRESVEEMDFSDEQLAGLQHMTSSERNSELHSERASSGTSKGCSRGSKKKKRKGRESVEEMDFSDEQLAGLQRTTSSERNSELHSETATSSGTSKRKDASEKSYKKGVSSSKRKTREISREGTDSDDDPHVHVTPRKKRRKVVTEEAVDGTNARGDDGGSQESRTEDVVGGEDALTTLSDSDDNAQNTAQTSDERREPRAGTSDDLDDMPIQENDVEVKYREHSLVGGSQHWRRNVPLGSLEEMVTSLGFELKSSAGTSVRNELKNFLIEKGIPYRVGPFTAGEDAIIRRNWDSIIKKCNMEHPEKLLDTQYLPPEEKIKLNAFMREKKILIKLAKGLQRTLISVYARTRRLVNPKHITSGKWSQEQKEDVSRVYEKYGGQWGRIAYETGFSQECVNGYFINKQKKYVNHSPFTEEEDEALIRCIQDFTGQQDVTKIYTPIPWVKVALDEVFLDSKRTAEQLRLRWINRLCWSRRHLDESGKSLGKFSLEDQIKLIRLVYESDAILECEIDFDSLLEHFPAIASPFHLKRRFHSLKTQVPDYNTKTFIDIIEYLFDVTLPKLVDELGLVPSDQMNDTSDDEADQQNG